VIWRWAYSLGWYLGLPLAFAYLWRRGSKQPAYRLNWPERLGIYPARLPGPLIWLHAVSVGETRAALPLVQALRARHPDHAIVLTHMTPTGRETAAELFGDTVTSVYLPYDLPHAVAAFLRHFQPRFGVLMEMEIWPNLLHAARQRGIPMYLVNARLSTRSAAGYRKASGLLRPALASFAAIAAQGESDAQRLAELGATRPQLTGNIKFDFVPDAALVQQGVEWRHRIGTRPVWVAASTREGEEALLLDAQIGAALPTDSLLILVPRHPQRFDEVAALLTARGLRFLRRSAWREGDMLGGDIQVLLGDSMGELPAYYGAGDVAVMGGSLLDFGSHSVIEPCAQALPVVLGPSSFNFADAVREAVALGAARQRSNAPAVMVEVASLLGRPDERQAMGKAGLAFVQHHRGAVARVLQLLP
jgi:3-deoxy-D-manno-octulosonic-acid transferase